MGQTYLTRKDTDAGIVEFDSIAWAFETHVGTPDTREFNYAVLHGHHEDSPDKIKFWREAPKYDTPPDYVWEREDR